MKVRLQALKEFPYAGKRMAVNQTFDATGESDARVLVAVGFARRPIEVPQPVDLPLDIPMSSSGPSEEAAESAKPAAKTSRRGRGRYATRALSAEASE